MPDEADDLSDPESTLDAPKRSKEPLEPLPGPLARYSVPPSKGKRGAPINVVRKARRAVYRSDPFAFLASVVRGEIDGARPSDRIDASKYLIERAYGKSPDVMLLAQSQVGGFAEDNELTGEALTLLARQLASGKLPEPRKRDDFEEAELVEASDLEPRTVVREVVESPVKPANYRISEPYPPTE